MKAWNFSYPFRTSRLSHCPLCQERATQKPTPIYYTIIAYPVILCQVRSDMDIIHPWTSTAAMFFGHNCSLRNIEVPRTKRSKRLYYIYEVPFASDCLAIETPISVGFPLGRHFCHGKSQIDALDAACTPPSAKLVTKIRIFFQTKKS